MENASANEIVSFFLALKTPNLNKNLQFFSFLYLPYLRCSNVVPMFVLPFMSALGMGSILIKRIRALMVAKVHKSDRTAPHGMAHKLYLPALATGHLFFAAVE